MATLLSRYLLDEGAGLVATDDSPNGNDGTMVINPSDGAWYAPGSVAQIPGTSLRIFGFDNRNVNIRNDVTPQLFQSLTQVTYVFAGYELTGDSGYPRICHMSMPDGNGTCNMQVSTDRLRGRWLRDTPSGNEYNFPVGGATLSGYHVYIMQFDVTAGAGQRIRCWVDNVEQSIEVVLDDTTSALPADLSNHQYVVGNNDVFDKATQGYHCYFEAWSGLLTGQDRADATSALLLDCDTAWEGGLPPTPGDPSFCWSPDGGVTTPWQDLTGVAGYHELTQIHSAVASMDAAFVAENANQDFCFDWAQLETGRIKTSTIRTTGATGTRVRSRLVGNPMSKFTQQELRQDWAMQIKFSLEMDLADTSPDGSGIWIISDGTVEDIAYAFAVPTSIAFRVDVGGTFYVADFTQASVLAIKRHEEIDLRCKWTSAGLTAWLSFPGQAQLKSNNPVSLSAWPLQDLEIWLLQLEENGPSVNDVPGVVKSFRWECPAPIDTEIEAWT